MELLAEHDLVLGNDWVLVTCYPQLAMRVKRPHRILGLFRPSNPPFT